MTWSISIIFITATHDLLRPGGSSKWENQGNPRRDHYQPYVPPWAPEQRYDNHRHDNRRHDNRRQEVNHLRLDSLTKLPSEILATKLYLQLPPCPLTVAPPKRENLDRYCEYHGEKGHYTNDCFHLKKQLKTALESRKLNHLVKYMRQRGNNRGRQTGSSNNRTKMINMVRERGGIHKHKTWFNRAEDWMNVPISFPSILDEDVSDNPLIIEAKVEDYLIQRVFVDQGAPIQVKFGGGGLTRSIMMKFTVV
ncbi:hypothetical protein Tco_0290437 [Tanacetum coccineum]